MTRTELAQMVINTGVFYPTNYKDGSVALQYHVVKINLRDGVFEIRDVVDETNYTVYIGYNIISNRCSIHCIVHTPDRFEEESDGITFSDDDDEFDGYDYPSHDVLISEGLFSTEEEHFQASTIQEMTLTPEQSKLIRDFFVHVAKDYAKPLTDFISS